ncbi:MAG: long-chain fatty acid--CoA ligase, partial [Candidatus Krumholzibacteria bacterium]|nr:long-chain fatty acid--CoA ligase [Candidatus Krumholzibacteria bacterium]
ILSSGLINVPIYATLPATQVEFIMRDSEARAVFVSTAEQLEKIQSIRANLPSLSHVILFDDVREQSTMTLEALRETGTKATGQPTYEERIATIGKYDWASIIYTSGTTGDPKGAILNHWNFVSNVIACVSSISIGTDDRCLSFLPLSHVFERTAGYYSMLYAGVSIAYAENIDTVPQNLLEVKPTVMVSVPRLYEKMYARILGTVTAGSGLKKSLFFWAMGVGKKYANEKIEKRLKAATKVKYGIADKLVFRKLKARTGGKLRFFVSGGAPLSRDIAEFFYAAGLPILEGYGLTETSPVITVNTFDHFRFGTVGRPVDGVDVQIADDGEILVRGPNVMLGYYKKPELSNAALDGEWFHTGDIGYVDDDGFLTITDRKKDIIVTAGGKNVAPQPIENLLKTNKYITQAVIVGDKRKFISAVIVPNMDNVRVFAKAAGISHAEDADLVKDDKVIQKIHDEIERMSQHLASFERVKKFILLEKDFSIEQNELTPTLKVKRTIIEKKFEKEINALYAS